MTPRSPTKVDLSEWATGIELEQASVAPNLLPSGRVPIRDSFYTAPGYREIGMFYSCIPDAAYPWDPKIVKEIWKHAPDAIPMWVHWVFLSPQETGNPKIEVFGRHALGRRIDNQRGYLEPFRVHMPTFPCQGLTFAKPNDIWFIHQGSMGLHKNYKDLLGDYLPFDADLVAKVEDLSRAFRMTEDEYRKHLYEEMVSKPIAAEMLRTFQLQRERALARREVLRYVDKQYDKVSDTEVEEFYSGRGVRDREKKPMVVVGSTP